MQIKENHVLYGLLILLLIVSSAQLYNKDMKINVLETIIAQHEQKITELENDNATCVQHCEEIVKIDNEIILRMSGMFSKIGKYCEQPELLLLDGSVIASSTEQSIKHRNELLDELDIEYDEPIYNN